MSGDRAKKEASATVLGMENAARILIRMEHVHDLRRRVEILGRCYLRITSIAEMVGNV